MVVKKIKLYRGDVLEVILDDDGLKGYLVFLDVHKNFKSSLFGLIAVEPNKEGYKIEDLIGREYIAQLMAFVDQNWSKIGRLVLSDNFVWLGLYRKSLAHSGKIFVYKYGESEPYKELNEGDDLCGSQPRDIYFSSSLIKHYRKALCEHGLYNKPETVQKPTLAMTEAEELECAGVYGAVLCLIGKIISCLSPYLADDEGYSYFKKALELDANNYTCKFGEVVINE